MNSDPGTREKATGRRTRRRQKIALACEPCRSRKIRCDGRRPRCSACACKPPNERACTYPKDHEKSSMDKRLLRSLNERIAHLEGRLDEATPARPSPQHNGTGGLPEDKSPSGPAIGEAPRSSNFASAFSPSMALPQTRKPLLSGQNPSISRSQDGDDLDSCGDPDPRLGGDEASSVNAMGVAHLDPEAAKPPPTEWYGKSSVASFLSHIQNHLDPATNGRTQAGGGCGQASGNLQRLSRPVGRQLQLDLSRMDDYHLPPRNVADHLIDLYYTRVHSLYPFLHWPTLMAAYRRLWMSDDDLSGTRPLKGVGIGGPECSNAVFYCSLNAVFALGAQFSTESAPERKARSRPFARRARHLLRLDFLDHGNLALVQALLIMAQYLQSTSLPNRCWSVAGAAYRMAQGLGLHLESGASTASELNREMRRRVWHGCVCLDIIVGMTMGRPCLNSRKASVKPPSILEEEAVANDSHAADHDNRDAVSNVTFFVETTRLYKILDKILNQVYDPWKESEAGQAESVVRGCERSHLVSCVFALDSDLDTFEATVPATMRWGAKSSDTEERGVLQQQRNVLRTRILHTRILLYRPLLVQLFQICNAGSWQPSHSKVYELPQNDQQLFQVVVDRCSLSCVRNSQTLIEHIYSTFQTTKTGAPWFNSYYIYHSAMVLVLADLCPSIAEKLDSASLGGSWEQCLAFLDRRTEHDPECHRYLQTLKDISKYVRNKGSDVEGGPDSNSRNELHNASAGSWLGENPPFNGYSQLGHDGYEVPLFGDNAWDLGGGASDDSINFLHHLGSFDGGFSRH